MICSGSGTSWQGRRALRIRTVLCKSSSRQWRGNIRWINTGIIELSHQPSFPCIPDLASQACSRRGPLYYTCDISVRHAEAVGLVVKAFGFTNTGSKTSTRPLGMMSSSRDSILRTQHLRPKPGFGVFSRSRSPQNPISPDLHTLLFLLQYILPSTCSKGIALSMN